MAKFLLKSHGRIHATQHDLWHPGWGCGTCLGTSDVLHVLVVLQRLLAGLQVRLCCFQPLLRSVMA